MRTPIVFAAIAALIAAPGCATAPAASADLASTGEKQVCRRVEEMGSNLPKRICLSKADWEAVDKATNDDARRMLERSASRGSNGPEWK